MARKTQYRKIHCSTLVDMMKEGKSYQQVAAEIGVSARTLRNWRDRYPEFKKAYEKGLVLSCAWWETELMTGMNDKSKPKHWATSLIYTMKCRFKEFGYNERQEQSIEVTNKLDTMSNADLDRALKSFQEKAEERKLTDDPLSENQDQEIH